MKSLRFALLRNIHISISYDFGDQIVFQGGQRHAEFARVLPSQYNISWNMYQWSDQFKLIRL